MAMRTEKEVRARGAVVRQAAQLIRTHGWLRNELGSKERGYCAVGAISHVMWGSGTKALFEGAGASSDFEKWLREIVAPGREDFNLPFWNDYHCIDGEELVAYMEKYADEMDPRGGEH